MDNLIIPGIIITLMILELIVNWWMLNKEIPEILELDWYTGKIYKSEKWVFGLRLLWQFIAYGSYIHYDILFGQSLYKILILISIIHTTFDVIYTILEPGVEKNWWVKYFFVVIFYPLLGLINKYVSWGIRGLQIVIRVFTIIWLLRNVFNGIP